MCGFTIYRILLLMETVHHHFQEPFTAGNVAFYRNLFVASEYTLFQKRCASPIYFNINIRFELSHIDKICEGEVHVLK